MTEQTANVLGATGLVGSALTRQLLADDRFSKVRVFVRRSTGRASPKLEEVIVDYEQMEDWGKQLQGDVLFSCLGTTLKTAGSQEAQYRVDYTYQYQAAEMASRQGIKRYVLISSVGADPKSGFFYSRMKGELDEAVQQLPFAHLHILRPGVLEGDRKEDRLGESIGIWLGHRLKWIPGLRAYRPIHADTVATAMIQAATRPANEQIQISSLEEVFQLAGE
ncbi:MAG: NAD(P)H-binding protein [Bacteroidota bacterium]